jgi:tetratricopeptide (TPR) repeat protein
MELNNFNNQPSSPTMAGSKPTAADYQTLARQGETYRLEKNYPEALVNLNLALELQPNYSWALAHRGETYYQIQQYSQAIADFNQAIQLNPSYVWAIAHRGLTYRMMGESYYAKALADFSQAIDLKPDYAWAIAQRCFLYELMGCYEKGLWDFDRAVAIDPTLSARWRGKRGIILSYCGRYAEAIESSEQVLQEYPNHHIALYCIAVAKTCWKGLLAAQADINAARTALQIVADDSGADDALCRLGGLAALEGKTKEALTLLQKSILLEGEALDLARHDRAWTNLRSNSDFQALIA